MGNNEPIKMSTLWKCVSDEMVPHRLYTTHPRTKTPVFFGPIIDSLKILFKQHDTWHMTHDNEWQGLNNGKRPPDPPPSHYMPHHAPV